LERMAATTGSKSFSIAYEGPLQTLLQQRGMGRDHPSGHGHFALDCHENGKKRLGKFDKGKPIGKDRGVIAEAGLKQPEDAVTKNRLKVCVRVMIFGSAALRATLATSGSWIGECEKA